MKEEVARENRRLKEQVRTLQQKNRLLKRIRGLKVDSLIAMLRRRGALPSGVLLAGDPSKEGPKRFTVSLFAGGCVQGRKKECFRSGMTERVADRTTATISLLQFSSAG